MREFWHSFCNSRTTFLLTLGVLALFFFFFWGLFEPETLQIAWNRFAHFLGQLLNGGIGFLLLWLGFKTIRGDFKSKGKSH